MMRPLAGLLATLLAIGLSVSARAPAPLVARMLPALPVQATAQPDGATVVAWQPPPGQALACAYRVEPRPMELLGCARGGASGLAVGPGGDVGLRVGAGDVVELRSYGADGRALAAGRTRVAWRVWLPTLWAAHSNAPRAE